MATDPKASRNSGKFTLLEPKGPTNPTAEELTWRIVEPAQTERLTVLSDPDVPAKHEPPKPSPS